MSESKEDEVCFQFVYETFYNLVSSESSLSTNVGDEVNLQWQSTKDHTPTVEKIQHNQDPKWRDCCHLQEQRINTVVQEEQEKEGGLKQLIQQLPIPAGW